MTVRILDVQSELATDLLARKLREAGYQVVVDPSATNRLRVRYKDEQSASLEQGMLGYIVTDWQYAFIEKRLGMLHTYLTQEEREYVSLLVFHALRKEEGPIAGLLQSQWQQRLSEAIHELLEQDGPFFVDGLVRFRLRDYLTSVDAVIHEMVEQFLTDREYEEFVSMLRYMLDAQPSSHQVLHVYCSNDLVWMCDEQGTLIRDSEVTKAAQQVSEDDDVNAEDLAMSILITRSPCQIVIHDQTVDAPWPTFAETVERVFLERAKRCEGCPTCTDLQPGVNEDAAAIRRKER
ncbi:MAG: hypothetical protein A2201_07165 [Alicyclobacillus sp. RIFOXYA1_FULL_53_8]|nr:MAG: hypothetical protein A2201_07165 [Alicyclobacillus sp. RIFOXYA1_FULL_53_8]